MKIKKEKKTWILIIVVGIIIVTGITIAKLSKNSLFIKSITDRRMRMNTNTVVTYEPNEYTNKDTMEMLITISNSKGVKKIKYPDNDVLLVGKERTNIGIDYHVVSNGVYTFIIVDNEGNEEQKDVEINLFDKVEPKDFTPIVLEIKNTSVIIKGNAEDGDEVQDSVNSIKSGIAKYEYYVNGVKRGETEDEEFQINGLNEATSYSIYLIAYDKAGNSKKSETLNIITNNSFPTLTLNGLVLPEYEINKEAGYNEILFDNEFEIFGRGNQKQGFVKFNITPECWGKYLTVYNGEKPASQLWMKFSNNQVDRKTIKEGYMSSLAGVDYSPNKCAYSVLIPEGECFS